MVMLAHQLPASSAVLVMLETMNARKQNMQAASVKHGLRMCVLSAREVRLLVSYCRFCVNGIHFE